MPGTSSLWNVHRQSKHSTVMRDCQYNQWKKQCSAFTKPFLFPLELAGRLHFLSPLWWEGRWQGRVCNQIWSVECGQKQHMLSPGQAPSFPLSSPSVVWWPCVKMVKLQYGRSLCPLILESLCVTSQEHLFRFPCTLFKSCSDYQLAKGSSLQVLFTPKLHCWWWIYR